MTPADPAIMTLAESLAGAPATPTLLWGSAIHAIPQLVAVPEHLRAFTWDALTARSFAQVSCGLGVVPPPGDEQRIVCCMPRAKPLLDLIVAIARARLGRGGQLWVAGHKREGIRSISSRLASAIGPVDVIRIKRHCRVLSATMTDERRIPEPSLADFQESFDVPGPRGTFVCLTLPGTFSFGRLDDGTRQLLGAFDRLAGKYGHALDLGAGCGVLGAALAHLEPGSRVALSDRCAFACESARRTLARNELDNASVHLGDVVEAPLGPFELIVTNPPFHEGMRLDTSLIERFAGAARRRMAPGGRFLVVANRHLAYGKVIERDFRRVSILTGDSRYTVWMARP